MVSVIIPSYNRVQTIEVCINSILQQTFKKFEIIVVDDGSYDGTEKIVTKLIKKDSRVKYLKQDNSGAQVARNTGIKNSKYKWICFNDSDDEWLENKLETQISLLDSLNYEENIVMYSNCYVFNEEKNNQKLWEIDSFNGTNCFKELLLKQGPMFQSLLLHKNLLEKINLLDENTISWQEWDTSLRLAKANANFIHIKEPLFIYNLHSGDTISKNNYNYIKGYLYILNKNLTDFFIYYNEKELKQIISRLKAFASKNNISKKTNSLFNELELNISEILIGKNID